MPDQPTTPPQPYRQGQPVYINPRAGTEQSTLAPDTEKYTTSRVATEATTQARVAPDGPPPYDVPEPSALLLLGLGLAALARRVRR